MGDAVLLIPGFLGFGRFGKGTRSEISYFDRVAAALVSHRPALEGWIQPLEPPPTGRLVARVDYLHQAVADVLARGIDGDPARRPERVHLVGHSTGGVDARLMTNVDFIWDGGPAPAARAAVRDRVGTVVTVSAPLHGSPIADIFGGTFKRILPGLYLLSILATARTAVGDLPWEAVLRDVAREILEAGPLSRDRAATLLVTLDPATRADVGRFLELVAQDGQLIDDLRPARMATLNAKLSGGDHARLLHVVTAAPRPALRTADVLELGASAILFAGLYRMLYSATASADVDQAEFPRGTWLCEARPDIAEDRRANDGIVPSRSQTLADTVTAIVEGDHLDVIGHYRSEEFPGVTIFSSGSGFDDARFHRLWSTVGDLLAA
jgi:triacylglycerol lipase